MRDLISSIGFRYGNAGLTFVIGVIIARSISVGERGELSYLQAIIDLAMVGLSLGLPKVLLNLAIASRLYRRAGPPLAALCAVGVAGGVAVAALLALLKPGFASVAALVGLVFFLRFMMNIIDVRERSSLNFHRYYACFGLERILLILMLLGLSAYSLTLQGILWSMAMAPLCVLAVYLWRRPVLWRWPSRRRVRYLFRRSWPTGIYNALAALAAVAFLRIDHLVIGEALGSESLGLFAIAFMIINLINGVAGSLSFVALPKLIRRQRRAADGQRRNAFGVFGLIVLLYGVVWAIAPLFVSTVYGIRYAHSGEIFRVLVMLGVPLAVKTLLELRMVARNEFSFLLTLNTTSITLKLMVFFYLYLSQSLTLDAVIITSAGIVSASLPFLWLRERRAGRDVLGLAEAR